MGGSQSSDSSAASNGSSAAKRCAIRAVLDGSGRVRAGETFCVVVAGAPPGLERALRPQPLSESELRRVVATPEPEGTCCYRYYCCCTRAGTRRLVVGHDRVPVEGTPLVVEPAPLCLARCSCELRDGDLSAPWQLCKLANPLRVLFNASDEFGNNVCLSGAESERFTAQCSNNMLFVEHSPYGQRAQLVLQPLEPGRFDIMLAYGQVPLLDEPLRLLALPAEVNNPADTMKGVKCAVERYQKAGSRAPASSSSGFLDVTPTAVELGVSFLLFMTKTVLTLPIGRSLEVALDQQCTHLTLSEDSVGEAQLVLPKLDALRVAAAVALQTNKSHSGGPLLVRQARLRTRLNLAASEAPLLRATIDRAHLVRDAWNLFAGKNKLLGPMNITFRGENGIDQGGISNEFLSVLQRCLFEPENGLWAPTSTATRLRPPPTQQQQQQQAEAEAAARDEDFYAPLVPRADPDTAVCEQTGLTFPQLYELSGVVVSRTLAGCVRSEGHPQLPYRLATAVFKHVQSRPVLGLDLLRDDPALYRAKVQHILEHDVADLELTFTEDLFTTDGRFVRSVCLDPASPRYYARRPPPSPQAPEEADEKPVTESNKQQYVEELAKYRLRGAMAAPLAAFRRGFLRVVGVRDAELLSASELAALCCASAHIDVADMKQNTLVVLPRDSPQHGAMVVEWLWEALEAYSEAELRLFLLFVAGSMSAPQGGFARLQPRLNVVCLSIGSHTMLPRAHTCSRTLELPPYRSFPELCAKLRLAITEGSEYNGMA